MEDSTEMRQFPGKKKNNQSGFRHRSVNRQLKEKTERRKKKKSIHDFITTQKKYMFITLVLRKKKLKNNRPE